MNDIKYSKIICKLYKFMLNYIYILKKIKVKEIITSDGESAKDTNIRMTDFLNEVLVKYKEEKIAIISHGGSIKFLLLNWCKVNTNSKLEYKGKELNIESPSLLKLTFDSKELEDIEQILL